MQLLVRDTDGNVLCLELHELQPEEEQQLQYSAQEQQLQPAPTAATAATLEFIPPPKHHQHSPSQQLRTPPVGR